VILLEWSRPLKNFRVQVTTEAKQPYFSCPAWEVFIDRYKINPGRKFILYIDNIFQTTYFQYTQTENTSSCDSEELPPRSVGDAVCISEVSNSTSS
jgi:hypothetical protein